MRSLLSRCPGKAKNLISGGTSVPRGGGACGWHAAETAAVVSFINSELLAKQALAND
jgi:hypothetical protein